MDFRVTFKNISNSPNLANYAKEKLLDKITKYVQNPIEAHVTFTKDGQRRLIQCNVFAKEAFNVIVSAEAENMRLAIDRLADKLESRLRRRKEKIKDRKRSKNASILELIHQPENYGAPSFHESIDADDLIKYEQARLQRKQVAQPLAGR